MNKTILIALLCLWSACKAFSQPQKDIDTTKLYIIFIEKYKNDTVSVWIDGCPIVKDRIITSGQYGLTDLQMIISKPNHILTRENEFVLPCTLDFKTRVNLRILLNKKQQLFKIDLRKGCYLGIDKGLDKLFLIQSEKPFEFD